MKQATVTILNKVGFHARPASLIINTVKEFDCTAIIEKGDKSCQLNSVIEVLKLQCKMGDAVTITCDGEEEENCLNALLELINSKFGEE